jgi:hypothetical protein
MAAEAGATCSKNAGSSSSGGSRGSGGGGNRVTADEREVLVLRFNSLLCPITLEPFVDPVVAAGVGGLLAAG